MSPALAPQPAPLARIKLARVRVEGFGASALPPVFHVFEELSRRALQASRPEATSQRARTA